MSGVIEPSKASMSSLHAHSSINETTFAPSDDTYHNGEDWCSAASKDPWDPAILALDGGGIRGYSSLIILKSVMHQVFQAEERLKDGTSVDLPVGATEDGLLPCHYFDYMYGTSTGGLIAVMLARLRMTVPQCLDIYREVGDRLFGKQRSRIPLTTKYHHQPLEASVRKIVQTHCKQHIAPDQMCDGDDWFPWEHAVPHFREAENRNIDFDHHICQAICLTSVHNGRIDEAHLMRTYNHEYDQIPAWVSPYNPGADKLKVWQVTRATSAAPFYFDWLEADLHGESWRFKDGGIRENNPAGAAWSEFVSRYGENKDPALLLSIGTGRPDESKDGFATTWPGPFGRSSLVRKFAEKLAVIRNVLIKYTDSEIKHRAMLNTARGEHGWYKRLNVDKGLESMSLDEWKKGEWRNMVTGELAEVPGGKSFSSPSPFPLPPPHPPLPPPPSSSTAFVFRPPSSRKRSDKSLRCYAH